MKTVPNIEEFANSNNPVVRKFSDYLDEHGIGTDIHYATPPHRQPCYIGLEHAPLPVTERLADEIVSLPIAHPITPDDSRAIAEVINRY